MPTADKEGEFSNLPLEQQLAASNARVAELEAELSSIKAAGSEQVQLDKLTERLVEAEQMANLGHQVAGIAHEINTPVGIGVTAASYIREKVLKLQEEYSSGKMRRSTLDTFIKNCADSSDIVLRNLERASELIKSFKQVAVDQSSHARRRFTLDSYLEEILLTMRPRLKQSGHDITVQCPESITMDSYPGALAQVVTNLLENSLVHAFESGLHGEILLRVELQADTLSVTYQDNGRGIPESLKEQVFEPHFTTRRDEGGSGLGLNIIRELVTGPLSGTITLHSAPGSGTRFELSLPLVVSENKENGDSLERNG